MDWARSFVGFGPPKKAAAPVHPLVARHQATAGQRSAHELCQEQLLAQRVNAESEEQFAREAADNAAAANEAGDRVGWDFWRAEEAKCKAAAAEWRGKMRFTSDQMRVHESATSNLQQALVLGDGARELQSTMTAMEALDVEDSVDTMREHADKVGDHSKLFSEPLLGPSMAEMQVAENADEEWDRLQAARVANRLPNPGSGGSRAEPQTPMSTPVRHPMGETNQ
jgi:hypothetical protein